MVDKLLEVWLSGIHLSFGTVKAYKWELSKYDIMLLCEVFQFDNHNFKAARNYELHQHPLSWLVSNKVRYQIKRQPFSRNQLTSSNHRHLYEYAKVLKTSPGEYESTDIKPIPQIQENACSFTPLYGHITLSTMKVMLHCHIPQHQSYGLNPLSQVQIPSCQRGYFLPKTVYQGPKY